MLWLQNMSALNVHCPHVTLEKNDWHTFEMQRRGINSHTGIGGVRTDELNKTALCWPKCLTFFLVRLSNISEEMLLIPNMLRRMYTYKTHFSRMTSQHASLELINCCLHKHQIDLLWIISVFACCQQLQNTTDTQILRKYKKYEQTSLYKQDQMLVFALVKGKFSVIQGSSSQPEQLWRFYCM